MKKCYKPIYQYAINLSFRDKEQADHIMLSSLVNLIYPLTCSACDRVLLQNEYLICTGCLLHLPGTGFTKVIDNPVARLFWGRIRLTYATSMYYFYKGGKLQNMIHKLKYRGQFEIGILLGTLLGHELNDSFFRMVDVIIPVPMHKQKIKKRGYNQSEWIASGISREMKKPLDVITCVKTEKTETQTNKTRFERWQNVESIFTIREKERLKNSHVLIVDDVVTTGSTLEACAREFLKIDGVKVSIATVAVADMIV